MVALLSQLLFIEAKILLMNLLMQLLQSISIVNKVMKKRFNKNLIMSEEEGHLLHL